MFSFFGRDRSILLVLLILFSPLLLAEDEPLTHSAQNLVTTSHAQLEPRKIARTLSLESKHQEGSLADLLFGAMSLAAKNKNPKILTLEHGIYKVILNNSEDNRLMCSQGSCEIRTNEWPRLRTDLCLTVVEFVKARTPINEGKTLGNKETGILTLTHLDTEPVCTISNAYANYKNSWDMPDYHEECDPKTPPKVGVAH